MITRKSEYAILALWELSRCDEEQLTANQIAQRQSIPPKYLPQIVSELSRAGLVTSSRGYGGGIKLGRSAKQITLLEIITAIQGELQLFECQSANTECKHFPRCDLKGVYLTAQQALHNVFKSRTLDKLLLGTQLVSETE